MNYKTYEVKEYSNGTIEYYKDGKLHREDDKPAIERFNGDKEWYLFDEFHRENGPAVIFANGEKRWFKDGKFHREDGPAVIFANGNVQYYLNNIYYYTEEDYYNKLNGIKKCNVNVIKSYNIKGKLVSEDTISIQCNF